MDATALKTLDKQRVNDIEKAQAQTVYKLSRVIGCSMEDLLERPIELLVFDYVDNYCSPPW